MSLQPGQVIQSQFDTVEPDSAITDPELLSCLLGGEIEQAVTFHPDQEMHIISKKNADHLIQIARNKLKAEFRKADLDQRQPKPIEVSCPLCRVPVGKIDKASQYNQALYRAASNYQVAIDNFSGEKPEADTTSDELDRQHRINLCKDFFNNLERMHEEKNFNERVLSILSLMESILPKNLNESMTRLRPFTAEERSEWAQQHSSSGDVVTRVPTHTLAESLNNPFKTLIRVLVYFLEHNDEYYDDGEILTIIKQDAHRGTAVLPQLLIDYTKRQLIRLHTLYSNKDESLYQVLTRKGGRYSLLGIKGEADIQRIATFLREKSLITTSTDLLSALKDEYAVYQNYTRTAHQMATQPQSINLFPLLAMSMLPGATQDRAALAALLSHVRLIPIGGNMGQDGIQQPLPGSLQPTNLSDDEATALAIERSLESDGGSSRPPI